MTQARLQNATITRCSLEIPLEDFVHLPRELGCSLLRSQSSLTLESEQPGCALHFAVQGATASLEGVDMAEDPHGRFFRDVVGLVVQLYGGDLEAELSWSPKGAMDEKVVIKGGETSHPLLFQTTETTEGAAGDFSLPLVEQWLSDARNAWNEYQRRKGAAKNSPEA